MGNRKTEKNKRRKLRKRQREHPEQRPGYRGHNQRPSFRDAMDMVPDDLPDGAFFAMAHEIAGLEYGEGFDELADEE